MSRQYNTGRNCPGCAANSDRIRILENRISFLERNLPNKTSTPIPRKSRSLTRRGRSPHNTRETPPRFVQQKQAEKMYNDQSQSYKIPISTLPTYTPGPVTSRPQMMQAHEQAPQYNYQPQWQYQGAPPDGGSGGYYYSYYPS